MNEYLDLEAAVSDKEDSVNSEDEDDDAGMKFDDIASIYFIKRNRLHT